MKIEKLAAIHSSSNSYFIIVIGEYTFRMSEIQYRQFMKYETPHLDSDSQQDHDDVHWALKRYIINNIERE